MIHELKFMAPISEATLNLCELIMIIQGKELWMNSWKLKKGFDRYLYTKFSKNRFPIATVECPLHH